MPKRPNFTLEQIMARLRDGDTLGPKLFDTLSDHIEALQAEVERLKSSVPLETILARVRTTLDAHIGENLTIYKAGIIEVEIIRGLTAPKGLDDL